MNKKGGDNVKVYFIEYEVVDWDSDRVYSGIDSIHRSLDDAKAYIDRVNSMKSSEGKKFLPMKYSQIRECEFGETLPSISEGFSKELVG